MAFTLMRKFFHRAGYDLISLSGKPYFPPDFTQPEKEIIQKVKPYTMTTIERLYSLIQAVKYIEAANIAGDCVECGVWRGGSMMAMAYTLSQTASPPQRNLYLFDTYEGMTPPGDRDVSYKGRTALIDIAETTQAGLWKSNALADVQKNLRQTRYDFNKIKFVKGKVEDTIPQAAPDKIALLRLDTDWYESTRHELIHLYPRLVSGGVLIIDDYGHWQGARQAVDEYFAENKITLLLNRLDYTGRLAIKP